MTPPANATSAGHTPGPWHANIPVEDKYAQGSTIRDREGNVVAVVYGWSKGLGVEVSPSANARLIAAAPEMAEALRVMLDTFNVANIDPLSAFVAVERARALLARVDWRDPA